MNPIFLNFNTTLHPRLSSYKEKSDQVTGEKVTLSNMPILDLNNKISFNRITVIICPEINSKDIPKIVDTFSSEYIKAFGKRQGAISEYNILDMMETSVNGLKGFCHDKFIPEKSNSAGLEICHRNTVTGDIEFVSVLLKPLKKGITSIGCNVHEFTHVLQDYTKDTNITKLYQDARRDGVNISFNPLWEKLSSKIFSEYSNKHDTINNKDWDDLCNRALNNVFKEESIYKDKEKKWAVRYFSLMSDRDAQSYSLEVDAIKKFKAVYPDIPASDNANKCEYYKNLYQKLSEFLKDCSYSKSESASLYFASNRFF